MPLHSCPRYPGSPPSWELIEGRTASSACVLSTQTVPGALQLLKKHQSGPRPLFFQDLAGGLFGQRDSGSVWEPRQDTSLTKLMGARGFFCLDTICTLCTKLPHSQRRLWGLQAASLSPKAESKVNRRASTGKGSAAGTAGRKGVVAAICCEQDVWRTCTPRLGGLPANSRRAAAPPQMGADGLSQAREGPGPLPPHRPSSWPRLTSCFSSRLGQGVGERRCQPRTRAISSREPPTGSERTTPSW